MPAIYQTSEEAPNSNPEIHQADKMKLKPISYSIKAAQTSTRILNWPSKSLNQIKIPRIEAQKDPKAKSKD